MSEVDLAFVTDEDLWNELSKRYEAAVFTAVKPTKTGNGDDRLLTWRGSFMNVIGLITIANIRLVDIMKEEARENEQEDRNG